jgi:hypothetical protein
MLRETRRKLRAAALAAITVLFQVVAAPLVLGTTMLVLALLTALGDWVFDNVAGNRFHWNWTEFLGLGFVFTLPALFLFGIVAMSFWQEYRICLRDS